MIGGQVVAAVMERPQNRVRIDVSEVRWVDDKPVLHGNTWPIYLRPTGAARSVSEGDSIWWQDGWAYWTPRSRAFTDYRLRRNRWWDDAEVLA